MPLIAARASATMRLASSRSARAEDGHRGPGRPGRRPVPDGTLRADAVLARLLVCPMSIRATHRLVSRAPPYTTARPLSNTEGVMWKSRWTPEVSQRMLDDI